jgi:hypothetical protein
LLYAFIGAIVAFWAGAQVVNLIFHVVSRLLWLIGEI